MTDGGPREASRAGDPPSRHGPGRGEHLFRLIASLAALVLFAVAAWVRGVALNIVTVELALLTVAFFGGSAVWSGWQLWKMRTRPD